MNASVDRSRVSLLRELPRALAYPLHFETLFMLLVMGPAIWFFSRSLFGLFVVLMLGTGLIQYVLINLRHVAHGGTAPPQVSAREFLEFDAVPVKLLFAVLAIAALVETAALLHPLASQVLTVAGFVFLPAFAALLILEGSLHYALNPLRLVRFVLRGGAAYLLFAALFGTSVLFAWRSAARPDGFELERLIFNPPEPASLAWFVSGIYLTLAMSYLLGRIAHTAHDHAPPSGHAVAAPPAVPEADSAAAHAARLDALVRAERRDETLAAWEALGDRGHEFQQELLDELIAARTWPLVARQAQRCVSSKLAAGRRGEALQTALRTLTSHESFTTSTAAEWQALCETAAEMQRGDWLRLLANGAAARFAGQPELLDMALLYAEHLANRQNDLRAARAALAPYLDWQSHPRHARLARFHAALGEMLDA